MVWLNIIIKFRILIRLTFVGKESHYMYSNCKQMILLLRIIHSRRHDICARDSLLLTSYVGIVEASHALFLTILHDMNCAFYFDMKLYLQIY